MKVLIACEESQKECIAFRKLGVEAYSCDIQECSGGHPEWHIKDNVLNHLYENWDLIIAHPPCTYLSNAGARWLYKNGVLDYERYLKGLAAKEFFMEFYNYPGPIVIENPMPSKIFNLPKPDQIIHPYQFGDDFSKKTYLWLKGVPPLLPLFDSYTYKPYISTKSCKGCSRVGGSSKARSKSFDGIAAAMAQQWKI